jgi:hypothetical protein
MKAQDRTALISFGGIASITTGAAIEWGVGGALFVFGICLILIQMFNNR